MRAPVERQLPRRVLRFIREHDLCAGSATLLVAVSGGPDSVCLLHLLLQLRSALGVKLHGAHLHHQLRGAEADADATYVVWLSKQLDVQMTVEQRDVRGYRAKRGGLSLEEAAREVRYSFLAEVAAAVGAGVVAVGHTADDQVETILLHLLRGSGLEGLRGMRARSRWPLPGTELALVRPLLGVGRGETQAYCAAVGLSPRSDSSNRWPNLARNRVRTELIPLLESFNPGIRQALLRIAAAADADLGYIEEAVLPLWGPVVSEDGAGAAIDNKAFSELPPSLQRHLLRAAIRSVAGDLRDIGAVHIEALLQALARPAGKSLSLPQGLAFYGSPDRSLLTTAEAPPCPLPLLHGEHRLNIPGETSFAGWRVRATVLDSWAETPPDASTRAYLDFDVAGSKLVARGRRRGDRFQPLGMGETKRLQDFMVDAKIPRWWRDRVPLVSSPEHIVWVVGYRIDHRARVGPWTRRILSLEFSPSA